MSGKRILIADDDKDLSFIISEMLYQRENYFGKFTWAFDNMRRELGKH